jgi:hypothetical protein
MRHLDPQRKNVCPLDIDSDSKHSHRMADFTTQAEEDCLIYLLEDEEMIYEGC